MLNFSAKASRLFRLAALGAGLGTSLTFIDFRPLPLFHHLHVSTSEAFAQSPSLPNSKGTYIDSISSNPISLFGITNNDNTSDTVAGMFFESLLSRHWDTFDWKPELASAWEISKDGKEFTFTLDPKARFWDGSPVTSEDVKFSYDIIFMEGVDSVSLKPYYEQISKVEPLGKNKIKFTVKDVYYKNFDVCAGLTIYQKKHYLALYGKDKTMSKASSTKSPMGTSQWRLEKWDDNQQVVLRRDETYWNKDKLVQEGSWNYDRHIFKIISDSAVKFETFRKGDITQMGMTPKQFELQAKGKDFEEKIVKVKAVNKAAIGYGYVAWNNLNPILANKDVRWALSHLMDLQKWVTKLDYGLSEPTVGPYSPKMDEHDPTLKAVKFSLSEARARLAKAGWTKAGPDGFLVKDGTKFEISILYPVQSKETAEPRLADFKNQAAKVGVLINLKALEWTSFLKLIEDKKFEGATLAWTRAIDGDLKQIWHSSSAANNGSNFISYSNPEVDKLINEHRVTLDRSKRVALARRLQKMIYEDQPYSFMTEPKFSLYGHQKSVVKEKDTYNYAIGTSFWRLAP
jgi:microcin C transport system substrate-binding protein